ncbi:MAG TPA: tetratricopeptide repeat protein [Leptolyngbyaceae cyanobacterium M33_DOE_097]|uniref:Tetratricopeptide repeat protein n=1 Tax=Oscillatoriales cyanobacterium SpSt-418 TaxID=2282169 RepID=A0A7C3PNT0_9CYAN|nr:tetratricopeptide repeat protein [Leptolyngbyaceae cyanobacterium M33_DOE_097]
MTISLCMIVRDEAENLPACLASAREAVDEVIVVDTGSRDRTAEIAADSGAQVFEFEWCDDFAAARNASLRYAQSEWILVLDADETLVPEVIPTLRQMTEVTDFLAVSLLREEVGAAQTPYSLLSRLFRNREDVYFAYPYHELIDDSIADLLKREPDWRVVELPDPAIRHTGYTAGAIVQRQKFERARRIMETYLATHPNHAYLCNKLGALYADSGETDAAIALLQRGLADPDLTPMLSYELHYHLGDTYRQLGQLAQAEPHYQAALSQPIQARLKLGVLTNWGSLRLAGNDATTAKKLFEQSLQIEPTFAIGHYNLGLALKQLGDLAGAISHYQQAIALNPNYADAHQNLAVALLRAGQVRESVAAFNQAIALHETTNPAEANRLKHALKEMGLR